jgi:hypothetical protein
MKNSKVQPDLLKEIEQRKKRRNFNTMQQFIIFQINFINKSG